MEGGTSVQRWRFIAIAVLSVASGVRGAPVESPAVYEITAGVAVAALPSPLSSFFNDQSDVILRGAKAPSAGANRATSTPSPATDRRSDHYAEHFLMLDAAAEADTPAARRRAARAFPRDRQAAVALLAEHGHANGGSLPWALVERYEKLVGAFRAESKKSIGKAAGALIHYATDAAMPFNVTAPIPNTEAQTKEGDGHHAKDSVEIRDRQRRHYHVLLVKRLRGRLTFESRVWPERVSPRHDPLDAAFEVLADTHEVALHLSAIGRESTGESLASGSAAVVESPGVIEARLAERVAPLIEERIEAGALLGASLILGAWIDAGSPMLQQESVSAAAQGSKPSADPSSAPFLASRHSKVFHRAGCSHAKRIKPDNLLPFAALRQALETGRSPCKHCKPAER